ncbi:MAG: hypothetical protein V4489_09535 [Chlamydiota bacterium]
MEKEWFMTKKDVKRIFLRNKKQYIRLFIWTSCLVLFFCLIEPPHYTANATFRFSAQGQEQSDLLRSFLQNNRMSAGKEGGTQAVLESRTLLRLVVEDLGLLLEGPKPFFCIRWMETAKDRIFAECGAKIPDRKMFAFSNVHLAEESPSDFFLRFTSEDAFEICGLDKKKIGFGALGSPVEFQGNRFTLMQANSIRKGCLYKIQAQPWFAVVKNIRSQLKVKLNKTEKNIFTLGFSHSDPEVSSSFLNRLMRAYREHLKQENEEMASIQMQYLEKRQAELMQKYERSLDTHTAFLHQGLKETGFIHLKQEKDFLERPSEEYLARLHDVDLKLSRLKKNTPSLGEGYIQKVALGGERFSHAEKDLEVQGITPEVVERLSVEYNQQWDLLRMNIEQLSRLQQQIFKPDFEITSLSGVLPDSVSQEMIQKAGRIALELQDVDNHSGKDKERMKNGLEGQKRFLSQHLVQLLETQKLNAKLLKEKISSLQDTSFRLLGVEKDLIMNQLASLQHKMETLPEKWKRENQLTMQRDLSLGMLEGLAQLTESKNVHHQLFYVESKPIDLACTPVKPMKGFIVLQGALAGILLCFFMGMRDCMRWLSKGLAITEDSASRLGITFCGFLPLFFRDFLGGENKETLRKVSAFISAQRLQDRGVCISVLSSSSAFCPNVASLLHLQGLKVLMIECSPAVLKKEKEIGLYDYLSEAGPIAILQDKGFDRIYSGGYEGHFVELLFRKKFAKLIEDSTLTYDVVILSLDAKSSDAAVIPIKVHADAMVIHAEDVFYDKVDKDKKLAVVLSV